MHTTPSHYQHYPTLLTGVGHIRCKIQRRLWMHVGYIRSRVSNMYVISFLDYLICLCNISDYVCPTVAFRFKWSREYICNSSYQKYKSFPLLSYSTVVACLGLLNHMLCHLLYLQLGFCFHYYCVVYDMWKSWNALRPEGRFRLFAHHTAPLSSLCKLIWGHWTYEMLFRYIISILFLQEGPCVIVYRFILWWLQEYNYLISFIITKSEIWIISHRVGLGHEKW